jgi:hypothetical protein
MTSISPLSLSHHPHLITAHSSLPLFFGGVLMNPNSLIEQQIKSFIGYHPISQAEAEDLLEHQDSGCYLIRPSSQAGYFTLSHVEPNKSNPSKKQIWNTRFSSLLDSATIMGQSYTIQSLLAENHLSQQKVYPLPNVVGVCFHHLNRSFACSCCLCVCVCVCVCVCGENSEKHFTSHRIAFFTLKLILIIEKNFAEH